MVAMSEQFPEEFDPTVRAINEVRQTMDGQTTAGAPETAMASGPTPENIVAEKKRLGIPIKVSEAPADVSRSVIDDMTRLRVLAGEILPSNDQGVDMQRIDTFFTRRGLAVQPATILTPEALRYYLQRLKELGFTSKSLEELGRHTERDVTPLASYEQRLGRIIALRPPGRLSPLEIFKLNYNIAHEKAHSSAGKPVEDMVYTEDDVRMMRECFFERSGLANVTTGEGIFLEEGESERQAAKYAREELNMPGGFWPIVDPDINPGVLAKIGSNEQVPLVYIQPSEAGSQPGMTIGALPAYGLELLMREAPELEAALESNRPFDEHAEQITGIINGISPGLGDELLRIDRPTPGQFNEGLRLIKRRLGYS